MPCGCRKFIEVPDDALCADVEDTEAGPCELCPYWEKEVQTVHCAWCGKVMVRGNTRLVSHGMCSHCKEVV